MALNVFDLDRALVTDYEHFARSFTQIRAPDIRQQVEALYASDRFWPEPLISINPRFERGSTVNELVDRDRFSLKPRTYSAQMASQLPCIGIKRRPLLKRLPDKAM